MIMQKAKETCYYHDYAAWIAAGRSAGCGKPQVLTPLLLNFTMP